jgi:predicted nucleic acid-binding protein
VPNLPSILDTVDEWFALKEIEFVQKELEVLYPDVLSIIRQSSGALNFNDAALVALQREGIIGEVATFDATLASQPGFLTIG